MKRYLSLLLAGTVGCSGMNNTESGALGGGLIGAALGTVVGAAARNPLAGAAIGGAAGAGIGALAGNAEDKRDNQIKQAQAAYQASQMTLTDVVKMAQEHVPDEMIIDQMNRTYTSFNINADQIIFLRQQGVSDRVIQAMQFRRPPPPGYVYRGGPNVVYVEQPPPVGVGLVIGGGGGYRRHW